MTRQGKATQTRVKRMGGFSGNGRLAGDVHDLGAVAYILDDTVPGSVDSTGHVQADPGILERASRASQLTLTLESGDIASAKVIRYDGGGTTAQIKVIGYGP